jgi:hypothetical protein
MPQELLFELKQLAFAERPVNHHADAAVPR